MMSPAERREEGFALIAVLWAVTLLAVLAGVGTARYRVELQAARNRIVMTRSAWAVRACVALVQARAGQDTTVVAMDTVALFGQTWCNSEPDLFGLRVDLNLADSVTLARILGPDRAAAVLDWRDSDDWDRAGGSETQWYLAQERRPPRHGPLASLEELRYVRGFSPGEIEPLSAILAIGTGPLDPNLAPDNALRALSAFPPERAEDLVAFRRTGGVILSLDHLWYLVDPGRDWMDANTYDLMVRQVRIGGKERRFRVRAGTSRDPTMPWVSASVFAVQSIGRLAVVRILWE